MSILELKNISYKYQENKHYVFKDINYSFEKGKIYAIVGKSGTGKTTLLSLLSSLTKPTEGEILYEEKNIETIDKYEYRSNYVGVIFQSFNLLPLYTAKENIILSMDISNMKEKSKEKEEIALNLLEKVGLNDEKANRKILKLSGGEQQRTAVARALSYDPQIILADEPTGNLDKETESEIIKIFKALAYDENKCVIIVTHSPEVAKEADFIYKLK